MRFASALSAAAIVFILSAACGSVASAEDAATPAAGAQQTAPDAGPPAVTLPQSSDENLKSYRPQPPQPPPPQPLPDAASPSAAQQSQAPDAAKDPQACIEETGDYVTHGNAVTYVIGLENKCDKRLKCKIYAYVVGARGPASGETTMVLGAKSSGAAKQSFAMKVKSAGGMAQVSRDCRML